MDNQSTGAQQLAPAATRAPFPNLLAALVPTLAVAGAALAVVPLIAVEQFGRQRGDADPDETAADAGDREQPEHVDEAAGAREATAAEAAEAPAEPIALDSRRETRRSGAKREKNRDERAERRSERVTTRDERPRRRRSTDQAEPGEVDGETQAEVEPGDAAILQPAPDGDAAIRATAPDHSSESSEQTVEPGAPGESGLAVEVPEPTAAVAAAIEQPTTLQRVVTDRNILVAPMVDTAVQSPRTVERLRVQKEQAEKAILSSPDVTAAVAPLVRHVNVITEQLNEAQMTIGRLTAERDALRQRLMDETGSFAEQIDRMVELDVREAERRQPKLQRIEARENGRVDEGETVDEPGRVKRFFQQTGFIIPEDAGEAEFKQAARKRQIFAVVLLAAIGLGMWLYQRDGNSIDSFSRDSLAQIQYIGAFVQVIFVAWILFRMVRIGGKGAQWVFPKQNTRKRRR